MVICLGWPSPTTSSSLPAASLPFPFADARGQVGVVGAGRTSPPIWPCSDWGLPCHRCYQRCGGLLPHRFTLTLKPPCGRFRAVCFLWPYPSPFGAQELPGSLPDGARTFLGRLAAPATIALDQPLKIHRERLTVNGPQGLRTRSPFTVHRLPRSSPRDPHPGQTPPSLVYEGLELGVGRFPLVHDSPVLLPRLGSAAEPLVCRSTEQSDPAQHAPA